MASQWTGAAPPPPGVEPNFVDPISHDRGNIALHTVCIILVTLSVAMRLYTRIYITKIKVDIDDYLCILSYCLTVSFSGLMFKCYSKGIGRHIWDTPALWIFEALKYFTIATYIYILCAASIKLTFLFFYRRLFSIQSSARYFINSGIIFVLCLNLGLFFATLFSCTPVEREWDTTVPGHCIDPVILPWLSGASSSATDIYVLVLPIPLVWNLKMGIRYKLKVLAVFSIGAFSCAASLVRLGATPILHSSHDATWNLSYISLWATLEVNVGIICACLMLLPAFLDRHFPTKTKSFLSRLWSRIICFSYKRTKGETDYSFRSDQNSWTHYQYTIKSESLNVVHSEPDNNILHTRQFNLTEESTL
ncbi:hypothetical protein F5X99DRAFT_394875 [Biscogniauxia marginata]|nr:hypothetical protein F5X99DRAFT_394875 [Biscogniauxia marginata]